MEKTMDALEALLTRRAVREYTPEAVTPQEIETLLKAAMHAPSARNQQPWHFVVVTDRAQLNAIAAAHPHAQMLLQAPLAVLVCADPAVEVSPGFWPVDCSAATQNLLLAARALGLGSVWVGVYPNPEYMDTLRSLLGLPAAVQPHTLVAVGHAAGPLPVVDRTNPERVHTNRW